MSAALAADRTAQAAYDALPFTHRQEYARWIDEAKKAETRAERVRKTIARLTRTAIGDLRIPAIPDRG